MTSSRKMGIRFRNLHFIGAICYIVSRLLSLPLLLNDYAKILNINIFDLGTTYLKLCNILNIKNLARSSILEDPCLYINRFAFRLSLGKNTCKIANLALKLIIHNLNFWDKKSIHPQGLYGAALFLAASAYGDIFIIRD